MKLNLIVKILANLPIKLVRTVALVFGYLLYIVPNEQRRTASINVRECFPDWSASQRRRLLRQTLVANAQTLFESPFIWLQPLARVLRLVVNVRGQDQVRQVMERGQGVIFAIPHIGNWELLNLYCASEFPCSGLYRPLKVSALSDMVKEARERAGTRAYPTNASGVRALLKALRQHEAVIILPDQDPSDGQGVFASFFGVQARTATLLPRLQHKTGAHVFLAQALRTPAGFEVMFDPIEINGKDLPAAAETLNAAIEGAVTKALPQFQWTYKRFKSRPDGSNTFYQ